MKKTNRPQIPQQPIPQPMQQAPQQAPQQRLQPRPQPKPQAPQAPEEPKPQHRVAYTLLILLVALLICGILVAYYWLLLKNDDKVGAPDPTLSREPGIVEETMSKPAAFVEEETRAPVAFAEKQLDILSRPRASVETMEKWAKSRGADPVFVELAPLFYEISVKAGVDPLVAYCQSALETNFMHFTGVVTADFHNPAGLKVTEGGNNDDHIKDAHMKFPDWRTGIEAQVQHLALYAGAAGYPLEKPADPRHFKFLLGTATTVESLGGKWAPNPEYGTKLRAMMEAANAYK